MNVSDLTVVLGAGRVAERLVVVLSGLISLAFGWNLFRVGVLHSQSAEASFKDWRIRLTSVGPGTFFALFGAAILAIALSHPFAYEGTKGGGGGSYAVDPDASAARRVAMAVNTIDQLSKNPDLSLPEFYDKGKLDRALEILRDERRRLAVVVFGPEKVKAYVGNQRERLDSATLAQLNAWMTETTAVH